MKKSKSFLIWLVLLVTLTTTVTATSLNGTVDIDWRDLNNFTIEVDGGKSQDFNCMEVRNSSNYNNFDKTLVAEVKYQGLTYASDVRVDWRSLHAFRIETESENFNFDCDGVPADFDTWDDTLTFTFEAATPNTAQPNDVESVIRTYMNYSEKMQQCELGKLDAEKDRDNFESKWTGCEAEGGEMKNEVKNLRLDSGKVPELEGKVSSLTESVSSCQDDKRVLTQQRDDATKKSGQGLYWGIAGAGIVYFINRRKDVKPPEQQETAYDNYPAEPQSEQY